jgi:NADH-quinone oxidoreductase subunit H
VRFVVESTMNGFSFNDPFGSVGDLVRSLLLGLGLPAPWVTFIQFLAGAVLLIGGTLGGGAIVLIWIERKVGARFQDRLGPNRVGPFGIFQNFADAVKLITKEDITPSGADKVVYNLAPLLVVMSVVGLWVVVPFAPSLIGADLNVGVLYLLSIGGVGTLGIMLAGMSSNNKYALLGALRSVAMLVSFEIPMALVLLVPTMLAGSMGTVQIVGSQSTWYVVLAPVAALIFFISSVAEIGRAPFDLLEAESEIVAGYNIEYSGMKFGLFMVSEFLHAFTVSALTAVLFLGGWRGPGADTYPLLGLLYFFIKSGAVYFVIIWFRFSSPRVRIDQMMSLNWKFLTPLALAVVVATALVQKAAEGFGWPVTPSLLGANILLAVLTLFVLRAYARALRRQVEMMAETQARPTMGAATGI